MKKKMNHDFMQGLKELSIEETTAISGGSDIWSWAGHVVAYISNIVSGIAAS